MAQYKPGDVVEVESPYTVASYNRLGLMSAVVFLDLGGSYVLASPNSESVPVTKDVHALDRHCIRRITRSAELVDQESVLESLPLFDVQSIDTKVSEMLLAIRARIKTLKEKEQESRKADLEAKLLPRPRG